MKITDREISIFEIEENYCNRLEILVENEQFCDAHSLFEEFVVDSENPSQWMFIPYLKDVH